MNLHIFVLCRLCSGSIVFWTVCTCSAYASFIFQPAR